MKRFSLKSDLFSLLSTILFLLLGLVLIIIVHSITDLKSEVFYIFLFFFPILGYSIFSGKLSEFTAGSFAAKFSTVSEKPIEWASQTINPSADEMLTIVKDGAVPLRKKIKNLDESKPKILALTLGQNYSRKAVITYMQALAFSKNFEFVVILNEEKKYIGCFQSGIMFRIIENHALGEEFIKNLNEASESSIKLFPGLITDSLTTKDSYIEALNKLTQRNLNSLIVLNENRNLCGFIDRNQIMSKILILITG